MTKKKDLKKRVRARQARTGESYTAALRQLKRPQIETAPSATVEARREGFRCDAAVSPKLRAMGDLRPLFARLRALLEALESPACGPLFRGEVAPLRLPKPSDALLERRYVARVREGERGLGAAGRMAAFSWNGGVVIAHFSIFPNHTPLLLLGLLEDAGWPEELPLMGIGR